jgi:hypothetical protein
MRRQHTGRPCRATIPLCRETNAASACARTRCDVNGRVHYALSSAEHHVDTANHRTDGCEKYAREVCYIATPPRLLLLLLQSPTPPGWTRSTAWKHETTGTMRGVRCRVCTRSSSTGSASVNVYLALQVVTTHVWSTTLPVETVLEKRRFSAWAGRRVVACVDS